MKSPLFLTETETDQVHSVFLSTLFQLLWRTQSVRCDRESGRAFSRATMSHRKFKLISTVIWFDAPVVAVAVVKEGAGREGAATGACTALTMG